MERADNNDHSAIRLVIQDHLPHAPDSTAIFLYGHPSAYEAAFDIVAPPRASDDAGQAATGPTALSSTGFVAPDDVRQAGTAHLAPSSSMGCSPSDVDCQASSTSSSGARGILSVCGEDSSINPSFSAIGLFQPQPPHPFSEEMVAVLLAYLPVKDVFRFGYLLSDKWLDIWKSSPLVCHDIQFAPSNLKDMLAHGRVMDRKLSVSRAISRVLDIHPGPVKMLRVDRCSWTGGNTQMFMWLHQLSQKKMEVLFLAGRWPRKDKLDTLPSNIIHLKTLRKLYLSFLNIPELSNADEPLFPQLDELQVSHCTSGDKNLRIFLQNCRTLETLSLGYIKQYALSITSQSLQRVKVWKSKIDFFCVGNCPKLCQIEQEMEFDETICSHIQIRDTPALHEITFLQLHRQTIEIYGYHIRIQMNEFPRCESLRILGVLVDFSARQQLELLPSLLKCFPKLWHFFIIRVDSQRGIDMDWRDMFIGTECMQTTMRRFEIYNCQDEAVESNLGDVFRTLSRNPHRLKVNYSKPN